METGADNPALSDIPLVDLRAGGPPRHCKERGPQARALRDACIGFLPRAFSPLIPALDLAARRWLERSGSPYLDEIGQIATTLDFSGVWLLNASYQWGCTALAVEQNGAPWLVRTLDWPFLGLGRYVEVAHMRGAHGDFYSVTWPGYVGALTAMAPGRFAACVNQAPMWRRTAHRWLRALDLAANARTVWRSRGWMPPDQLLRLVFERCADFVEARHMLESTPVARPVIYSLAGCAAGERCVIERTETSFVTREDDTSAANDWVPRRPGWEGRIGTRRFLTSSFEDAAGFSRARRDALKGWDGSLSKPHFAWVCEPVLNPYTRLAVAMCPANGVLQVVGYEPAGGVLPEPATRICEISPVATPQAA